MGGAGSGFATWETLHAQREAQQSQFAEQRTTAERELRQKAYSAWLAAFDDYQLNTSPLADCLTLPSQEAAGIEECKGALRTEPARLLALRQAKDQVNLYGSDAANAIVARYMSPIDTSNSSRSQILELQTRLQVLEDVTHWEAEGVIVAGATHDPTSGLLGCGPLCRQYMVEASSVRSELESVKAASASRAPERDAAKNLRADFEAVMCREVNAAPRSTC